jgi:serine/threonine protein kinase/Flp pilus assembly protein TadD
MTANPPQIEEILAQAVEIGSADQRQAYIDRACAGQPELQREVERLASLHFQAGSFLESPPAPVAGPATLDQSQERPGVQVGPYKLLEQIGEGGFGVVYMAEQHQPVRRKVALKVLKPGMDSRQIVARFEAERQALALMDHPNIARVFDGGTAPSGRPYFVMELVKGAPITDYCDQHRLTPRQRLELFVSVCQAVQHAHQKGVIHRDIKPTNVLVTLHDTEPVVKVIDFGVAKALGQELTDKTLFTGFAQMVGTPLYMSPEQAGQSGLDIDTRSDIYSLGVLLYELLTGTTPFEKTRFQQAAYDEIRRIIREEEPPKPSTRVSTLAGQVASTISEHRSIEPQRLSRTIRGELDWIVMKALEKDRNRRYETASSFAADLQRYLADEPVQACPPSAMYRFRKMARRNKRALATVTLLILAALAVMGAVGWSVRERVVREAAVQAEVDMALQEAERWRDQAKWPEALSDVKRAEGLLAGTESNELRERAHQLRKELELVVALEAYRAHRGYLVEHQTQKSGYPGLFANFGMDVENMSPPEVAAQIARRPGTAIAVAGALDDWAQETQDSATLIRLLEAARLADPDPWRSQLRQLMGRRDTDALRKLAEEAEMLALPVQSVQLMGNFLAFAGDSPACIAWLRRAHRQYPGDSRISFDLAFHLSEQNGQGDSRPVDLAEALRFAEAALASRPSPAMHDFVGNILFRMGRYDEAIACAHKAIEIAPDFNWDRRGLAEAYRNLGDALVAQHKSDAAIPCYHKAIELKPTEWAYKGLGDAFAAQGMLDEAITCYDKAIELNPQWDWPHCNLGDVLATQGKLDDAIVYYRKAIELDPHWSWPRLRLAIVLNDQAWALTTDSDPAKLDPDKAVILAKEAVELAPNEANYCDTLGAAQYRAGHWQEAISALQKYRELRTTDAEWTNPFFLAMAHWQLGNKDEAVQWYDKAVDWMARRNANSELMVRLRTEAAELLKIDKKE